MRAGLRGGQVLTRARGESDRAAALLAFGARAAIIATATAALATETSATTPATAASATV